MRFTIGGKIFGITVCLLVLMGLVCAISTRLIFIEGDRLLLVAEGFSPLADHILDYRRAALRRQMRLAKLYRALDAPQRDEAEVLEQRKLFEAEALEARKQLDAARELAAELLKRDMLPREREELVRQQVMLDELLSRSVDNLAYSRKLEEALEARDAKLIASLTPVTRKAEEDMLAAGVQNVTEGRRLLHTILMDVVGEQRRIVRLSFLVAAIAALLGVLFSMLVIRGLVRPVSNLMQGVRDVEGGNLSVDILVESTDEIGTLTRSFNHMVGELRAKERLKDTFGKYIDPRVVETLLAQGAEAAAGQREVMTIFFSDLVGFTAISERLTPTGLVHLMNRYLTMMSAPIRAHQGLIDKYIGDAIMAFWGPPFTQREEHAQLACFAALDQVIALTEFRTMLPELMGLRKGLPDVDFRIGIATGEVVVGNIGSETTRAYTVLGDTVNLGSRLEGANKQYGTRILISEETERLARGHVETREIDRIAVKGKVDPIRVYEVLARAGALSPERQQLREVFERGIELYRDRNWNGAEAEFQKALAIAPDDGPSRVYADRVLVLKQHPPEKDWDGVWRLTAK